MKKILLLLLISVTMYGQVPADATPLENIQITNNTTDNLATKVVVQSTNNVFNTVLKTDLQDAFYFATASALPVTGITDKLYITRDNNKLYRFNGTIYQELTTDISGKEDISNKSSSYTVSSTVTYPSTKALVDGLATKVTGAGTTNYIQKSTGTGTQGNSSLVDNGTSVQGSLPLTISGAITATSLIKTSAPATNALLAGGTTLANPISGTGTTGYLPKFTNAGVLGNSLVSDNGIGIGIGTTSQTFPLEIWSSTYPVVKVNNTATTGANIGSAFRVQTGTSIGDFVSSSNNTNNPYNSVDGVYLMNRTAGSGLYLTVNNAGFERKALSIPSSGEATFVSSVTATAHITVGGTASQYVKGDGSLSSTVPDSRPYKVYTALISQIGTSVPTATVLENTFGSTMSMTRISAGNFRLISSLPLFTVGKTVAFSGNNGAFSTVPYNIRIVRISDTELSISTNAGTTASDNIINDLFVEIRTYN